MTKATKTMTMTNIITGQRDGDFEKYLFH